MVSAINILRSGYYILRMLPFLFWAPLSMKLYSRRAAHTFEDELLRNGLEPATADQLVNTFKKANRDAVKQLASLRSWNERARGRHDHIHETS
jgi:hypothetical protein